MSFLFFPGVFLYFPGVLPIFSWCFTHFFPWYFSFFFTFFPWYFPSVFLFYSLVLPWCCPVFPPLVLLLFSLVLSAVRRSGVCSGTLLPRENHAGEVNGSQRPHQPEWAQLLLLQVILCRSAVTSALSSPCFYLDYIHSAVTWSHPPSPSSCVFSICCILETEDFLLPPTHLSSSLTFPLFLSLLNCSLLF